MSDEVIEELWRIKDSIAREHRHDIRRLAAHLQSRGRQARNRPADRHSVNEMAERDKAVGSSMEGLS